MTVKEYAIDVALSVAEVLKKCQELSINVKNADDILSDDDITILDNTINLISTNSDITYEESGELDDKVDELIASSFERASKNSIAKQKLKKKDSSKNDYNVLKKQMYKNKNKLMKNDAVKDVILYKNNMTVGELAEILSVSSSDLIKKLIGLGLILNVNQVISFENAEVVALEYGKNLIKEENQDVSNFEEYEAIDKEEDLVNRPPIVTIMGHVDHGKTTLLDYIRSSHVVDKEFGGITQHIGAYQIDYEGKKITFIDTPGHEAFTEMRARGASITDIVIIIVAADDGVKPQTKEAVDHAKVAGVPIIVAVNKIDKPDADINRVLTEMSEIGITPDTWGGDTPFINISAHTGENIPLLLETIITLSELKEFKANPNRYAMGTVIESRMDKLIGGVASFIIQNGTLRIGDPIVVGQNYAKIRTMKNDLGENIVEAYPSMPVEITGLTELPSAGDKFMAFETESEAKAVADKRKNIAKQNEPKKQSVSLDDLFSSIDAGNKEINIVLKADVRGSEEAVKHALEKITTKDVVVKVIRSGIGAITESDVILASASNAIILGFNVVATNNAISVAKDYNVDIRTYTIIYKLVEDIEAAILGMLDPVYEEHITAEATVRQIFKFSKVGNIAGCYVTEGVIKNNSLVRVIRDGIVLESEDKIVSLQRGKDSVKEVKKGFECGLTLEKFKDIREKDIIVAYEMVEIKNAKS